MNNFKISYIFTEPQTNRNYNVVSVDLVAKYKDSKTTPHASAFLSNKTMTKHKPQSNPFNKKNTNIETTADII